MRIHPALPAATLLLAPLACGPRPDQELSLVAYGTSNTATGGANGDNVDGSASSDAGSGTTHGSPIGSAIAGWPQIPNQGGGTITHPNFVLITFDGDPNRAELEADVAWLSTSEYLSAVGGEYGIQSATYSVAHLSQSVPKPSQVTQFLAAQLASGALPAVTADNIYALVIPQSDASIYCGVEIGDHSFFDDGNGNQPPYAVIGTCDDDVQSTEVTLSHELIEAATDPQLSGYRILDPNNPWTYLGGEVADLCESNGGNATDPTGRFAAAYIWSNLAAQQGVPPCGPWPSSQNYRALAAPVGYKSVSIGQTASFTVTGWTSASGGAPSYLFVESDPLGNYDTAPELSADTISAGGQVTVTLKCAPNALPGQHGAAWIIAVDPTTGENMGSMVVAVQAGAGD